MVMSFIIPLFECIISVVSKGQYKEHLPFFAFKQAHTRHQIWNNRTIYFPRFVGLDLQYVILTGPMGSPLQIQI